jgi:hypothetical protein
MTNDTIIQKCYIIHKFCVERDRAFLRRDKATFNRYDALMSKEIHKLKKEIRDEETGI